jgi:glycosyltransferase involved in cell wall biosynthesis
MESQPKILMIITSFYPAIGGTQMQAFRLARALVKQGYQVSVLSEARQELARFEVIAGISLYREVYAAPIPFWGGILYILSTILFLLRYRRHYDIIHCHQIYLSILPCFLASRLLSKKLMVKIACSGDYSDLSRLASLRGGQVLTWTARQVDTVVAINEEAACELEAAGFAESQIVRIPNGVDLAAFHPATYAHKLPNETKYVIFVGQIVKRKGVRALVIAFGKICRDHPTAKLRLIGDGVMREEILTYAADHHFLDRIDYVGQVPDVYPYLSQSSIFVLPSTAEGIANALLEAMACGLPIITTNIPGNRELIVDDLNGLLIEPNSVDALAESMHILLTDKALAERLGRQARLTVEKEYSLEAITDQYIETYQRLVQ